MIIERRERVKGEWKELEELTKARVRTLDRGGIHGGDRLELIAKGVAKGDMTEYYRTMVVVSSSIYGNGATRFTGFVTDDYEEYSEKYHLEEWVVVIKGS